MTKTVRYQLSGMMFLEFFIWGAWFVTLWRYLNRLNFDGTWIGAAYSTTGWAAVISPFFVGMIADRFFPAQKVLACLHLAGA
ncbi:MAG TPA: MFS transporter, partial [Anaerohalosphaeraceae bacterium]|nr:MFS transporter [Anaerohalosphaeraceae bacterium]